jgi:hypothetical protein
MPPPGGRRNHRHAERCGRRGAEAQAHEASDADEQQPGDDPEEAAATSINPSTEQEAGSYGNPTRRGKDQANR